MIVGFDATTLRGRLSGVGYYTARLMETLANGAGRGIVDQLVVLSNREVPVTPGERVTIYAEKRFGVRSVWMQFILPSILRQVRPDLVHFTNYLAPVVGRVPYVVSFHDMTLSLVPQYHTLKKRLLTSSLIPFVARKAQRILAPSESTRRDILQILRVDPARVVVIPYAAAPSFRPASEGPERLATSYGIRSPYLLYVGTLEPRKNLPRVLRAFARIAPSIPDQLVIAGDLGWNYEPVLEEAGRPELRGRVVLAGYVKEDDLPLLYTHATAFVYPSLYEGFGLPVVEAMACGAPVLTSQTSSLGEIAEGAAILVDPEDEAALADGLRALATDSGLRSDLRRRGLARAATFSWERTGRETAAVYKEVHDELRRGRQADLT
jgi:glycosyltransferase involved in cell wall biosynthesis